MSGRARNRRPTESRDGRAVSAHGRQGPGPVHGRQGPVRVRGGTAPEQPRPGLAPVLVLPLVLVPGLALPPLPPTRLLLLAPASGLAPRRPGRGPGQARREQEPMLSPPPRRRLQQKPQRLPQQRQLQLQQRLQQALAFEAAVGPQPVSGA